LDRVNIEEEDKALQYFEDNDQRGNKQTQQTCSLCGSKIDSRSTLAEHSCEAPNASKSPDNSETFLHGFSMVTSEYSEKKINKKKEFNKEFDELDAQIYENMTKDGVMWVCNFCDKKLFDKIHLKYHIERKHMELQLPCDKCGRVFTNRGTLAQHSRRLQCFKLENKSPPKKKVKNKEYAELDTQLCENMTQLGELWKCKFCDKLSNQKNHLRDHIEARHMTFEFPCNSCNKLFGSRDSLRKHKSRKCKVAEDNQKTNMDPVKIEEDEKIDVLFDEVPFSQKPKIAKRNNFREQDEQLKKNMTMNGDIWNCNFCDKKSDKKVQIISHLEVSHMNLKFPCDTCEQPFRSRGSLQKHKSTVCNFSVSI